MIILNLVEQANKYSTLNDWFLTLQGSRVAQAFAVELQQVCAELRGTSLLQLGDCGENLWLSSLKFPYKWIVSPDCLCSNAALTASLTTLPIDRNTVDCVIAPLSLEIFARDKNPLEEIDRILKPMGHVVFLGINPCSFWGAALYFHRLKNLAQGDLTLTSSLSVKHMMHIRGYKQCLLTNFYYLPPLSSDVLINKLAFFNEMGKMIWPFTAGFYCQIFQKYQEITPGRLLVATDKILGLPQKQALQTMRSRL